MTVQTGQEIREVREEVGQLLDELRLRAFIFTVEPKEDSWHLRVECATDGEWQVITLPLEAAPLLQRLRDHSERERLKAILQDKLCDCARASG